MHHPPRCCVTDLAAQADSTTQLLVHLAALPSETVDWLWPGRVPSLASVIGLSTGRGYGPQPSGIVLA